MTTRSKDPVFVVLQMSGGNDYLNTVIPYTDPLYRDARPNLAIPEDEVLPLNDEIALHPAMGPIKRMYDEGNVAIIHGVGWPNSPRSHFRSMDIWHTCAPETVVSEGWLGKAVQELDPKKENVVTAVSFGDGMFRALAAPGVPVACVSDLDRYGLLTGISGEQQRARALETYARFYSPALGRGPVMSYLAQTGLDAMKGADILKVAPAMYSSSVEYANSPTARKLRGIAQVHLANLGTRIFYLDLIGFDTHSSQLGGHTLLWKQVSDAISDFFDDLKEHDAADNVIMFLFSEFGRRVRDNGTGTDHGAAGPCLVIGDRVKGGEYGEYPSRKPEDLVLGDLAPSMDFRGVYHTILEKYLGLDPVPIVGGTFEHPDFL